VADPARKTATYDDVVETPPHKVAELISGTLYTHARPAARHARAASRLGGELDGPFDRGRGGPGGWILLDEPELHFSDDILVPDLAGWRRQRMPEFPYDDAYFTLAPDWICEVLSPSTARFDRREKLGIYCRERVTHAWLLDPLARTLEVLRLEGENWIVSGVFGDETPIHAEPFDAIALSLSSLWSD
jgi:Uma2 family endonuclease